MRKTRLAAAGAAAAIALSGTVAAADDDTDTQTVTITVTAAPLTLSLTEGNAVGFELSVNDESVNVSDTSGRLTYQNPTGSDTETARVTVTRDTTDLGLTGSGRDLTLAVTTDFGDVANSVGTGTTDASFDGTVGTEQDLITGIDRDGAETTGVELVLTLTGDAGDAEISGTGLQTTLTYTIKDGS